MPNIFNTLPYHITGDSPELLKKYDSNSRKKIIQLGWFALMPALLWLITGYLISCVLLGSSCLMGAYYRFSV